jgi:hypothetical protein
VQGQIEYSCAGWCATFAGGRGSNVDRGSQRRLEVGRRHCHSRPLPLLDSLRRVHPLSQASSLVRASAQADEWRVCGRVCEVCWHVTRVVCVCACVAVCLSGSSVPVSVSVSVSMSVIVSVCLSLSLCLCLSVCVCASVSASACLLRCPDASASQRWTSPRW